MCSLGYQIQISQSLHFQNKQIENNYFLGFFFSDSEFVLNRKKTVFSRATGCLRLGFVQVYISLNAFLQFLSVPMSCK